MRQTEVVKQSKLRPQLTIGHFAEKGKQKNKIVSRDSTIITDDGFLRQLLFKKKSLCGTSAIVLPNGRFLLIQGDPHFMALHMGKEEIKKHLPEDVN